MLFSFGRHSWTAVVYDKLIIVTSFIWVRRENLTNILPIKLTLITLELVFKEFVFRAWNGQVFLVYKNYTVNRIKWVNTYCCNHQYCYVDLKGKTFSFLVNYGYNLFGRDNFFDECSYEYTTIYM